MFGYFVRRVDKRFQLERSLGMLPQNTEEAVARLERLFSQVRAHFPSGDSYACLEEWRVLGFKRTNAAWLMR